ncbi:hypothetical protein FSARC_3345 [Fusarium sarcochroum]|uniref:Uncharacterized protein n=1 Tax=Fusarium sarcochroum TaxID=1208366 RepID=A0A8H4U4L0_9HYPO|nr:hypothetical protein FSARC_3345 [Fusarium sarcochroum]
MLVIILASKNGHEFNPNSVKYWEDFIRGRHRENTFVPEAFVNQDFEDDQWDDAVEYYGSERELGLDRAETTVFKVLRATS